MCPMPRDLSSSLLQLRFLEARGMSVPQPLSWLKKGCQKACAGKEAVVLLKRCRVGCLAYLLSLFRL